MKGQRTERLIRTVCRFLTTPSRQISLTALSNDFGVSKTVISDDVVMIDSALTQEGLGGIQVDRGRTGGASFVPAMSQEVKDELFNEIISLLSHEDRILPGGLIYYSDILFNPYYTSRLGLVMASLFQASKPDIVMTSEVKGIPLGLFTAHALGVPLAVCRFRNRPSDGSAVAVHFPTKTGEVKAMYMGTKQLQRGSRVLIVDDFMRGGSTAAGMLLVAKEFGADVCGIGVFLAASEPEVKAVSDYVALFHLKGIGKSTPEVTFSK
ncbi:MAG: phosphoribosyltransferase family protein [Aminobacterium sp.]|uniref:phosphoribosyltransferase family protein n=1 Tax=unclassified Aminobacterium TaxID=2685012 RepID=UPI001BCE043E|nr:MULTISPECIES: phosphoribosyltransferase family protein [unclassified Aminobacterium]MDD2205780.1 phosphoribosyltransferase family protein [Aminobacterium sp.]MDD3426059.1 phosphoribosyltransferase family protein [Aminobacterium sp.]MDD3706771.1 phosphoribosyltransferase family protein [Aminobacterium sp.]MDD4229267.1 phosphoribosyltransferase family protein [Aminobacterium sp.]MDD4550950.1 phosphoribosyltransferase family protein [Aminobacterium sp.]